MGLVLGQRNVIGEVRLHCIICDGLTLCCCFLCAGNRLNGRRRRTMWCVVGIVLWH